jgi:hypothetical protein
MQTTGLPQGDSLSGLLFVVIMGIISDTLTGLTAWIRIILYADDVVMLGKTVDKLQEAMNVMSSEARKCGLEINIEKTKMMKFRKGGRLSRMDEFYINGHQIPFVNGFSYLGFWITPTLKAFGEHVKSRRARSVAAVWSMPDPGRLSLRTAMRLFDLKVAPCATYGIREIWEHLSTANLNDLEQVKANFLKRTLGVAKNTRNRLVYLLAGETTMIERMVKIMGLSRTEAYEKFLKQWEEKFADINVEFLDTDAMKREDWKRPLYNRRHTICREAVHGFHHYFCSRPTFHEADENCVCRLCDQKCEQYHFGRCADISITLDQIAE